MKKVQTSDKSAYALIMLTSVLVFAFLVWLIYFKPTATTQGSWVSYLPTLNAVLNTLTTLFLIWGYIFIKRLDKKNHVRCMLSATTTSFFFLLSYITYHHFQGDTKFTGIGLVRSVYFFILISHIVLSAFQVPLILITLFHAFRKNFESHRKVARITFPIWLYVSTTGVLIYIFLNHL